MDENLLKVRRNEVIRWFKEDYPGEDGFPVFEFTGAVSPYRGGRNLLTDLGDYLPFLLWCGEENFVWRQIGLAEKFFRGGRFVFLEEEEVLGKRSWRHRLRCLALGKSVISFEHSDLLLGLIECYEIKKEKQLLLFIEYMVDKIQKMFYRNGALAATYYPRVNYRIPLARSTNGIFLELFVDLYRLTDDRKYLSMAEEEANFWIKRDFFKKYGLFPHIASLNWFPLKRWSGYGKTERTAFLAKDNTSLAAGILALFRATSRQDLKRALEWWIEGVGKYFIEDSGAVYERVEIDHRDGWTQKGLTLKSYALIEFLCDYHWIIKDNSSLKTAERIAEFYIAQQSPTTGLIPDGERTQESYFDSETDFGVSLMKLFERTGKDKYREAARKILEGQLKYHRTEHGYVNRVNSITGEITDATIETRYVSLFLKLILLFLEEKESYQDLTFYSLLRDR